LKKITIAIDGHSSTGKSTLAKELAKALGYVYVDSGAMYRCVALFAMRNGFFAPNLRAAELITALSQINISFEYNKLSKSNHAILNGDDVEVEIRTMQVSNHVSEVATIPEVRRKLVEIQQKLGTAKGVVMDGRDIGTVVFPDAELKIFMTANPAVRAQRRYDEMIAKGDAVTYEAVLENLKSRDFEDSNRSDSPLMQASDAKVLDNSTISKEKQFAIVLDWANQEINK
jgi:cytidylate kinase